MTGARGLAAAALISLLGTMTGPKSEAAPAGHSVLHGAGNAELEFSSADDALTIRYRVEKSVHDWERTVFVAMGDEAENGSAVLPFGEKREGSTVFLPFRANRLYAFALGTDSAAGSTRAWEGMRWTDSIPTHEGIKVTVGAYDCAIHIPRKEVTSTGKLRLVVYSKAFSRNSWGDLFGASDPAVLDGSHDKYFPNYVELDLSSPKGNLQAVSRSRLAVPERLRIYQLFVRLFGNINETRKPHGTLAENGVGKFADINDVALASLHEMGFSHVWFTGVLQQATGTDYSAVGQPADDADLLKGVAGSPYAIKDYYDVSPDYAEKPERRLDEFKALLKRTHAHGLKALIDLVPNHVARSYASDVKPDLDFGRADDKSKPFASNNNFFYLEPGNGGPPLRLPTMRDGVPVSPTCALPGMTCDGLFAPESEYGRVTGNNQASWTPTLNDWYETVKLNYGFNFRDGSGTVREYPHAGAPEKAVPDTWTKMDSVIAYWQAFGVDGFRCDMSHMVPPEFWSWAITRARQRDRAVIFLAEAYDNDPTKVPGNDLVISKLNGGRSNVMFDLLNAGFNAVYDDPTYKAIKRIYEGPAWANDIDGAQPDPFIFDNSLRYAENHDEVRLAARSQWSGHGAKVGPVISAVLYGLSRGPLMLYSGQEVAEPATGAEGFGGDDGRTSIFDYWSMPELAKWVNGHAYDGGKLSLLQKDLRETYGQIVRLANEPAFRNGNCLTLNAANSSNPNYGRLPHENASGHWLYSFLRYDAVTGQRFLVVANLHPDETLKDVKVLLNAAALEALGLSSADPKSPIVLTDRIAGSQPLTATSCLTEASSTGIWIGDIPPATPLYLELKL